MKRKYEKPYLQVIYLDSNVVLTDSQNGNDDPFIGEEDEF